MTNEEQGRGFYVEANPFGKQRPRYPRRGGRPYTPKETVEYEKLVMAAYLSKFAETEPYGRDTSICLDVIAYYPIPKSYSKKKRQDCLYGHVGVNKKPDGDNILKVIADGLNGIAFEDDKQIDLFSIRKEWTGASVGRVFVLISEKEQHPDSYGWRW